METELDSRRVWRSFITQLTIVFVLFAAGFFVGFVIRNRELIENSMLTTARSYFNSIVLTRRWNAGYGGVYVEKKPGLESNPYLENPDIHGIDGKVYTKKNPALMTREVSEIARGEGMFQFHITSLRPLNPGNQPDEFERKSLESFEKGVAESSARYSADGRDFYRYMAPLKTEASCLQCHAKQGYKVGDIRGGISVTFDITDTVAGLRSQFLLLGALGILTLAAFVGIVYFLVSGLMRRLSDAHKRIQEMAVRDELTQLHNRRYFFPCLAREWNRAIRHHHDLSVVLFDLDNFKTINDRLGHGAGDEVLKRFADLLTAEGRGSDVLARYGGEEFIALLPETDLVGATAMAERVRLAAEALEVRDNAKEPVRFTVSAGVSSLNGTAGNERDGQWLIHQADVALYRAKAKGRNRVEAECSGSRDNR